MSSENANPSINPANIDSLIGLLNHVLNKNAQETDGMLPAVVTAFNRNANTVSVQPLINVIDTNGNSTPRAPIANIPVSQFGGGGFVANLFLKPGDLGWIISNDRDISLFMQSGGMSKPNTFRKNNFADSVFFPVVLRGYAIADEDSENFVLQSLDGTVKVTLSTDTVTVAAPNVVIKSPNVTINNATTVNINSSSGITATTPLFRVVGNINASGTITPGVP